MKKQNNPKGKYTIHSRHKTFPVEAEVMNYVSFDPGKNNFDIRFESRRTNEIITLKQAKYRIPYSRTKNNAGTSSYLWRSVVNILDGYSDLLDETHIALIEDQMAINSDMICLMSCLIMYFLCKYPKMFVVTLGAKVKSKNLCAPNVPRPQLKAWGEHVAIVLAIVRKDIKFLEYLREQAEDKRPSEVKIDDSTDNYIQIEAFCIEAGYRLTETIYKKRKCDKK